MRAEQLEGRELDRFMKLCAQAQELGYRVTDSHDEGAKRFRIIRQGVRRIEYMTPDVDGVAHWLAG